MAIDNDIGEIESGIGDLKKRPYSVSRNGLYIMMIITMIGSIQSCSRTAEISQHYQETLQVRVENVMGRDAPEKFYDFNGQRAYLEIDGKPVKQYIQER